MNPICARDIRDSPFHSLNETPSVALSGKPNRAKRMNPIRRLVSLSSADRRLLVEAVLLLGLARIGLRLLPFGMLLRFIESAAPVSVKCLPPPDVADRSVWAVSVAGRRLRVLRTCLTQALAAQVLLRRSGYYTRLRLGVGRGSTGDLQAHAWLDSEGKILIGESELAGFTALPSLQETR
jgi:hypothetical protein